MKPSIKTLKNKADKLFQELGRALYTNCCLCGGEYTCLHHFIHRSQSLALRWDIKNGVPVCHKCHCRIHAKNDPEDIWHIEYVMNDIFILRDWKEYITKKKREVFKANKTNLLEVIGRLKEQIQEAE